MLFLQTALGYAFAQEDDFPRPDLNWKTIESTHFLVHFHSGEERSAREFASIAEEVYGPITQLYQHEPDSKVSLVIRDHDDYSNGAAYFYDNRIELWAPALDFELRGTHPWIRDVISHEFTHIVQIQTAMKLGRTFPAVYFQWLGYESERRPDVLYGYPNAIVSYPFSAFVVPAWFAEGVAQYNHPSFTYDYWDSHRDMILRMYMLDGNPLTWDEMAVFGKTSLGNESSYNAGFSIVSYIAETYGAVKLKEISRALSSLPRVTIDGAISATLGISGEELYEQWKSAKIEQYKALGNQIAPARIEGELIEKEGFGNTFPVFTPDGKKLAYVSNKGQDYFGLSAVYVYDLESKKSTKVDLSARSTLSFSPDGRYLYYSKLSRKNGFWAKLYDLYRYDLEKEKDERLTFGLRAWNPKLSSDGKKIVFAYGSDGTVNLGICDADGKNVRQVTKFVNGEQVYTPQWSPDGSVIAFGFSADDKQSVAVVDESGSGFKIIAGGVDSRNPVFSRDGRSLIYSAAEGGIFNLFSIDLQTGTRSQLTNVLGGAFTPEVSRQGDVAFSSYTSTGFKISLLKNPADLAITPQHDVPRWLLNKLNRVDGNPVAVFTPAGGTVKVAPDDTSKLAPLKARPYSNTFTRLTIIPILRVDNYNPHNKGIDIIRPGFYFTSSDVLDRLSLFGGAVINRQWERDLFGILEYRDAFPIFYQLGLAPTASLEIYNITRKTIVSFPWFTNKLYNPEIDVVYNLLEFDFGLKQNILDDHTQLSLRYSLSRYSADIGSLSVPNPPGDPVTSAAFRNLYLVGNVLSAELTHNGIVANVDRDINPVGCTFTLRYSYEFNKFNPVDTVENGALVRRYSMPTFQRAEFMWNEHLALPIDKHTLTLSVHAASTLGKRVDDFFDFYGGGFIGMRGYPFYGLGGNDLAVVSAVYRFPLASKLNFRFLQFYFTKLYASVFADYGDAWTGPSPDLGTWKKDAGFELRLESFSFYQYPTRIFFSGAYGFDRFSRTFNNTDVTYGKEWKFYLGVLFDFEMNPFSRTLQQLSNRTR